MSKEQKTGLNRVAVSKSGAIKIDEWFVRAFTGLFRSGFALKGLYISALSGQNGISEINGIK